MAILSPSIDVIFTINGLIAPAIQKNFNRPESQLRRWDTIALIPDDAPLMLGHPTAAPYWFRCTPVVSSSGEVAAGDRPTPDSLNLGADLMWLPYDQSWDDVAGIWVPWRNTGGLAYRWLSTAGYLPIISDISYRVGKEIITVPRMKFIEQSYLASDFYGGTADAVAWTMSFAVAFNSNGGTNYSLLDWGTPSIPTLSQAPASRAYIHVSDGLDYSWAGASDHLNTVANIQTIRPVFITMVVNPPAVTIYVYGGSHTSFMSTTTALNPPYSTALQFYLGRSADPAVAEGNFDLLAAALWSRALSQEEVFAVNAAYAGVYGAASE